ncbi:MAG: PEGA domain-containing protein [Verrucomicrobiaceae bacterium]|nr:MAG: PEGA domain-containing protein [Verrucomicrobiaceae bacterium]
MPVRVRPHPTIPDHEVLRKIGGGAYGEVWLARGVTGALRAVKVVWREDFEDERGFEREFEGILKFEPISRDHPALVNILHVGHSADGVSFYYYVMELGDDVASGQDINPIEYQPRTLRGDHPQAAAVKWDTAECIDVGLRLAEALGHLHDRGLAHRDVKPSNIIFVHGRAKLADIGLVAARGQRTFVGTEGFVPPEGPGSAQADIYSLGKVLYEMATGKDRMNFPELPDDMPTGSDRKRWLELNRVICDVCEPRISKRKITTAAELAEALRRIRGGKAGHRSMAAVWLATLLLTTFSGWAGWELSKDSGWLTNWLKTRSSPAPAVGLLRIFSTPEGADVLDANGVMIGTTPTPTMTAQVGEEVVFTLRKTGYRPQEIHGKVALSAVNEPMVLSGQLQVFAPPQTGETWTDQLGARYQPVDNHHIRSGFVTREEWARFEETESGKAAEAVEILAFSQDGQPVEVVLATAGAAHAFCRWLRAGGIKDGYLTNDHELRPLRETGFENPGLSERARRDDLLPFRVMVRKFVHSRLQLTSQPPGAEVYLNGQLAGNTAMPLEIPDLKPGEMNLLLVLEGYKPLSKVVTLPEGRTLQQKLTLEPNEGVVFGKPWENGIKMRFAPVGRDLMASIWETRVSDYALFLTETNHPRPPTPAFTQEPDHPAIHVSRDDARAFCEWLTRRERKDERITRFHEYRLPTDLEWSLMAGLIEDEDISPGWRDARKQAVYPWGMSWPNGEKVGNFADMTAARAPGVSADRTIAGYDDGFPFTAPVGSFPPNELGLYDLSGNVQEWVDDEYSRLGTNVLGVLRGGGWNTYQTENLFTGSRNAVPPGYRDAFYSFRVVLAKIPPKPE